MTETSTLRSSEPTEQDSAPEPVLPPPIVPPQDLFDNNDLTYFGSEDRHAGGVIGKMLSLFFFYTVIAMLLVAIWTFFAAAQ